MKRLICMVMICLVMICLVSMCWLVACVPSNYQQVDNVRKFDYAIIALPNGEVVSGTVEKWRDFDDGDQLQICIDGTWYLVHSTDAVLIANLDE